MRTVLARAWSALARARGTARGTALVAALAAALLGGCGVPRDDAPRALAPGEAPYASPRATPVDDPEGRSRVPLHFVRDDLLVLASRPVEGPVTDEQLLELLLGGPAPEEREAGLISVIPSTVTVEQVEMSGRTAVVTLGGPESEVLRLQRLAYGQIVTTLTPSRASGVRFRLDGADLEVPRGDNTLTAAPLSRDDYAALLAPTPSAAPPPSVPPAVSTPAPPAALPPSPAA